MGTISRVSIHAFLSSIDRRRRARRRGLLCLVYDDKRARLAQTSATDNPSPTAAQPSVPAQETPAAAAEEKPPAADDKPATVEQKPAPAEEKPAIAQDKPAAVEEKSAATDDKPAIVEQKPAAHRGETNGCAGQARSRRGEVGCRGRQTCHRRAEADRPGREACGCRAEAGSCRGKTSSCAREARLEAEVCRQAIKKRCPQQRGRAQLNRCNRPSRCNQPSQPTSRASEPWSCSAPNSAPTIRRPRLTGATTARRVLADRRIRARRRTSPASSPDEPTGRANARPMTGSATSGTTLTPPRISWSLSAPRERNCARRRARFWLMQATLAAALPSPGDTIRWYVPLIPRDDRTLPRLD